MVAPGATGSLPQQENILRMKNDFESKFRRLLRDMKKRKWILLNETSYLGCRIRSRYSTGGGMAYPCPLCAGTGFNNGSFVRAAELRGFTFTQAENIAQAADHNDHAPDSIRGKLRKRMLKAAGLL